VSLFNELKRRNVIRVSMAYLAGAWLILQVADTVIPWLGLGDAVGRILLIALIVGFIPAVIATWLFEWTPDGIRFDDEVEVDAAGAVVARRRLDRIIIGVLALAVVYIAVDEFLFDIRQVGSYNDGRSVAVLPFEDISPDGDQAYLGNGIADELRLELQHLDGLRVAGRTSSNAYAQEDHKTIGETLNVESILEGSVRKDGDRVRITVQLTNVADGFTIWSESYNRSLDKIFEMQEDIATSVAGALGVRLGVGGVNDFHGHAKH
jgi:TolB-like protein